MIRFIIFSITVLDVSRASASFASNAFTERCGNPYLYASQSCSRTPAAGDCTALASTCATGCADMAGFNRFEREPSGAPRRLQQCVTWGGTVTPAGVTPPGTAPSAAGAAARCDTAAALLTATGTQDQSVWEACVADCDAALAEIPAPTETLRQRYTTTANSCGDKITTTTPQDPITDDGGTVAEESTDTGGSDTAGTTTGALPVADTGSPNTPALNAALSGLGGNSSPGRIDAGKSVNFRGSGKGSEGYGAVSRGVGNIGHQGSDVMAPQRYDDVVGGGGAAPKADQANFGGGSGGGGGGGAGGGPSGGGSRPGGGAAPRTSAAAAQLAKGTNQFWAGGSGGAPPAKAAARTTAAALKVPLVEKPKFGPEYLNKGTGSDGLLRLWGAGMNRLPVDRGSQSCRDQTIFCNLENFDFEFKP